MSDYNPFTEGEPGPPEGGPELDLGEATGDGQPTEALTEEQQRQYLDLDDDVANRYVRVKVDGQDEEVPLREALQGYSRTSDYTRKTQALSAKEKEAEYALAVQRALQAQPEETLRLLSRQFGVQLEQSPAPPPGREQPSYDDGYDNPYLDPVSRRLQQQEQQIAQISETLQKRQANEVLQSAVSGLQRKYQLDDATTREVIGRALQLRMGPESFDMIYKTLAFDRAQEAREAAKARRSAEDQQREAAKLRGQQLVGSGGSANGAGGPPPGASDGRMSIHEAFDAAWEQHVGR